MGILGERYCERWGELERQATPGWEHSGGRSARAASPSVYQRRAPRLTPRYITAAQAVLGLDAPLPGKGAPVWVSAGSLKEHREALRTERITPGQGQYSSI